MAAAKSKKGVLAVYDRAPERVRTYFCHLPGLISDYPLDVALSYVFAQVELAHNMTLYCGAVKIHRCETSLTRNAVNTHHMTRLGFREKLCTVIGKNLPDRIAAGLSAAEKTRDAVMHGKAPTQAQMRDSIANVISYAVDFNEFVNSAAGFRPFGQLKGFKGRAQPLDKKTTRWVLMGMGFDLG